MKTSDNKFLLTLKKNLAVILLAAGLLLPYLLFRGFIFRLIALYTLPLIYVYVRIRARIESKKWRLWFTMIFILLVAASPVVEMLMHTPGLPEMTIVLLIGYYTQPFLLYLFLLVLLFDILLGLNRLLKIVPGNILKGKKFRLSSLGLLFFLSFVIVLLGIINFNTIRVNQYSIEIPKKNSSLQHLRIAVAADFHISDQTRKGFMKDFVEKIQSVHPDIVLIPGDIAEGDRHDFNLEPFEHQFRKIRSKYGVFASPGNHEYYGRNISPDFFSSANIRMLRDEWVLIENSFYLAGRNDKHWRKRKSLEELLRGMSEDLPVILMDHRPVEFDIVSKSRVNIQVSGHTHHGQLFPLNIVSKIHHELSWGHLKKGNTYFFVTCGIQLWGPQVRTAGISEIMLIDVSFRK